MMSIKLHYYLNTPYHFRRHVFSAKKPPQRSAGAFSGLRLCRIPAQERRAEAGYTIIETMTFRLSAVTWDQTSPYIPTRWFSRYSMGILNPSQRTVPSSSEILPFPNAWNRYTVKNS